MFMLLFLLACTDKEEFLDAVSSPPPGDETPIDPPDDDVTPPPPGDEQSQDDELKAFPSAQGAGAYAKGGRGGRVIAVTTLEDGDYEGTFRWALKQPYPRTVVFRVSGEIVLNSELLISGQNRSFLTIAGQTAPRGGITIRGNRLFFFDVDDIVIRYIRIRQSSSNNQDVMTLMGCSNIMIDHVSTSFGGDEAMSATDGGTKFVNNITIQRSLIGESKTGSIMGALSSGREGNAGNFSFHHNLFVDISHRFPNISGNGNFEIINNVIHNWQNRLTRINYAPRLNLINNYYQRGLVTVNQDINRIMHKIAYSEQHTPQIYTAGNLIVPDVLTDPNRDNWFMWTIFLDTNRFSANEPAPESFKRNEPFSLLGSPIKIQSAENAFQDVLQNVGSNMVVDENGEKSVFIDELDDYYINMVKYQANSLYRSVSQWTYPSLPSNTPYADSDLDGMPDAWERARGLNPNDPEDRNGDANENGYTNLEEFLNSVDR